MAFSNSSSVAMLDVFQLLTLLVIELMKSFSSSLSFLIDYMLMLMLIFLMLTSIVSGT